MSTLEGRNETGDDTLQKPIKTESATYQNESQEIESLSQNFPSKEVPNQSYDKLMQKCLPMIGEHENQVLEDGEANFNLHKHMNNCTKNPNHPKFIPIESLCISHLPISYQDVDLYELIKATADLTVKLTITMTSVDRLEFWPGTDIPYFLSNLRGKTTQRTGSGWVRQVIRYTGEDKHAGATCPCDKCKASPNSSKVWWKVVVYTAAHVVFDNSEANRTTVTLFYDSVDSDVVILKDCLTLRDCNHKEDKCWLNCAICDDSLGNKLKKMKTRFDNLREKVYNKYYTTWEMDRLNFIVSHPHGCPKQVTIGHCKTMVRVNNNDYANKFTYTTCTCHGSSGAIVHLVGYDWSTDIVHSGCFKDSGLSYSAIW